MWPLQEGPVRKAAWSLFSMLSRLSRICQQGISLDVMLQLLLIMDEKPTVNVLHIEKLKLRNHYHLRLFWLLLPTQKRNSFSHSQEDCTDEIQLPTHSLKFYGDGRVLHTFNRDGSCATKFRTYSYPFRCVRRSRKILMMGSFEASTFVFIEHHKDNIFFDLTISKSYNWNLPFSAFQPVLLAH